MALRAEELHPNLPFADRHPALKEVLRKDQFPNSIAIIPDGNRRWARKRGLEAWEGHLEGVNRMLQIIREYSDSPAKRLFLWGSSVDNLSKRTPEEIQHLNEYIAVGLSENSQELIGDNARLVHVGNKQLLGPSLEGIIGSIEESSSTNTGQTIYLALAYGGEDHDRRSKLRTAEFVAGALKQDPNADIERLLTNDKLDSFADADGVWRNVDLLIRTTTPKDSWEITEPGLPTFHLSGIGDVVGAKTVIATIPQFFPDLTFSDFDSAVLAYSNVEKRQGS